MSDVTRILVVHGPNLNLLGTREPEVYGTTTLAEIDDDLRAAAKQAGQAGGCEINFVQSNHEGVLIDAIQQAAASVDGIIINPAGLTHTSVSLRDALAATGKPVIEVHLSNVFAREEFRHTSMVSGIAQAVISGLGPRGYRAALEALLNR